MKFKKIAWLFFSGNLQCLSSGHCLYTNADKGKMGKRDFSKIPPGTNGVFERMMILWNEGVVRS